MIRLFGDGCAAIGDGFAQVHVFHSLTQVLRHRIRIADVLGHSTGGHQCRGQLATLHEFVQDGANIVFFAVGESNSPDPEALSFSVRMVYRVFYKIHRGSSLGTVVPYC